IWTAIRSWHTVTPSFAGWGTSSREEDGLDRDRLRGGIPAVRGLDHVSGRARRRRGLHGIPRAAGLPQGAGEEPTGSAAHGDHQRVLATGQRGHRYGTVREHAAGIDHLAVGLSPTLR